MRIAAAPQTIDLHKFALFLMFLTLSRKLYGTRLKLKISSAEALCVRERVTEEIFCAWPQMRSVVFASSLLAKQKREHIFCFFGFLSFERGNDFFIRATKFQIACVFRALSLLLSISSNCECHHRTEFTHTHAMFSHRNSLRWGTERRYEKCLCENDCTLFMVVFGTLDDVINEFVWKNFVQFVRNENVDNSVW